MQAYPLPSRHLVRLIGGGALLLAAAPFVAPDDASVGVAGAALAVVLLVLLGVDVLLSLRRWRAAPLAAHRRLPQALALGVPVVVTIGIDNPGATRLSGELYDCADASLDTQGLPLRFSVGPAQRQTLEFTVVPTQRGLKAFESTQIRVSSQLGLLDWNRQIGDPQALRVFPNFEQQARFAWLAGDRRLRAPGVKSVRRRGAGTDFDQLVEYRAGHPVRHIDWKATRKHERPIVRTFQDDRDQSVVFLLDCGRRMRADDSEQGVGGTHFDQCLNALMLLAFVALSHGDAVGAMTFGTPTGGEKCFAPRKGRHTLNALIADLAELAPSPTFSDYEAAAVELLRRQRKRGLLVLITNCRNEDGPELMNALRLLRSRHLVVLATLREQIVADIAAQPLTRQEGALEAAAALEHQQRRSDMLRRFTVEGVLTIDCEPKQLGVELVNRYTVLKGRGAI
jgi:uncharacterized protein (DUF58 family)